MKNDINELCCDCRVIYSTTVGGWYEEDEGVAIMSLALVGRC